MGFRLAVRGRQRLHRVGQNLDDGSKSGNLSPRFEAVSVRPLRPPICDAPAGEVRLSAVRERTTLFHPYLYSKSLTMCETVTMRAEGG